MFSTCRACSRLMTRQCARLVASSGVSTSEKVSTTAAAAGAGICCLMAYHFSDDIRKSMANTARFIKQQLLLHAAGRQRKVRRKPGRKAAEATGAGAAAAADTAKKETAISWREKRFLDFASVECRGQAFMTAADFLDAVIQDEPSNERQERRALTQAEANGMLSAPATPSKDYFRSLGEGGLISYTEYLFLLSILMKPHSNFEVAFKMFDTDGNHYVDRNEFLVMERIFANTKFSKQLLQGHHVESTVNNSSDSTSPFPSSQDGENGAHPDDDHPHPHPTLAEKVQESGPANLQNTSLMRRFFGRRGRKRLPYEDFHRFINDLQTEILEIEFDEYSSGQSTIKESDFASLLLRHASAHRESVQSYMKRVEEKLHDTKGITFEQYKQFCLFLTNLDDFTMAVKLYTYRDLPVTQSEFARAAKVSTGIPLDPHLVDTLFTIFDTNDDNRLSYGEFVSVMKDRLHRGGKRPVHRTEWQLFTRCVREEMKRY